MTPFESTIIQDVLPTLLVLALPPVAALFCAWIKKAADNLDAKTSSQKLRDGIDLVSHVAQTVVTSFEQTVKADLEKLPNGKLTPDAAKQIKADALAQIKGIVASEGASDVQTILGLGEGAMNDYLGHLIEAAVSKLAPPSSAGTPPPAVPTSPPAQ